MANSLLDFLGLNNIESILKRGVQTGLFLALLTPWVIISDSTFPALLPKAFYFRVLMEVTFLLYVLLLLKNRAYVPRISPLFLTVFIFIEVLAFSTLSAINPMRSFWGSLERAEGLILMLHLFMFYVMLVGVFRTKEVWLNLLRLFVLSSIPLGVIAVLEKFTTYAIYTDPSASRVSATFGNPLFYAAYLIFIIFISVFVTINDYQQKDKPAKRVGRLGKGVVRILGNFSALVRQFTAKRGWILFGILSVFNFYIFLLTGSRGAWIGVIVGIGLLMFVWLVFLAKGKKNETRRKTVLVGTFLVLLFFVLSLLFSEIGYIPDTAFNERYNNLWMKTVEGNFARTLVWDLGIQAWKDAPFLGYGIDSFSYIFDAYYHRGLLDHYPQSLFFDRAHNRIVDVLVFSGIIGLVSYIAIFVVASRQMLKYANARLSMFAALLFIALLIAYFLQNFVTFDTVTSYVMFFFLLAFLDVNFQKKEKRESAIGTAKESDTKLLPQSSFVSSRAAEILDKGNRKLWFKRGIAVLATVGILFAVWTVNIQPFQINMQLAYSHRSFGAGQLSEGVQAVQEALNGPEFLRNEVAYYSTEMMFFAQRVPAFQDDVSRKILVEHLDEAARSLENSLESREEILEMRGYLLLARVYITLAKATNDKTYLDRAERATGNAVRLNPEFPAPYRLGGKIRFLQDKEEEGLVLFSKAYEIDGDLQTSLEWVGESLIDSGHLERGTSALRRSLRMSEFYSEKIFNIDKVWSLSRLYEQLGDYAGMAEFYEEVISRYPGSPHPQLFASLSQAYVLLDDKEKARATTERMLELYPGLREQAEEFLSSLEDPQE